MILGFSVQSPGQTVEIQTSSSRCAIASASFYDPPHFDDGGLKMRARPHQRILHEIVICLFENCADRIKRELVRVGELANHVLSEDVEYD